MVSRKRNQGRARKERKAVEERENNDQVANGQQQQVLDAQMQRLQIDNSPTGPGRDTTTCGHGIDETNYDLCVRFVYAFSDAYNDAAGGGGGNILDYLERAEIATLDEFADVWNDSAKMEMTISHFLYLGARDILEGCNDSARGHAFFARSIEQYTAVNLHKTQAVMNWPKICETQRADDHTLVKFFRMRIPCSCLDKKYEQVKTIPKIGFCYNRMQCSYPNGLVERSKTVHCSRCRLAVYCSRGCQEADWPRHKKICHIYAAKKAEFDANHQKK